MTSKLNYCKYANCRKCLKSTDQKFRHVKTAKGEKYFFEMTDAYAIVFIMEGEVTISCNEYADRPLQSEEITLWSASQNYTWEAIADTTSIIFTGNNTTTPCDKQFLSECADNWLNSVPYTKNLPIKPRLMEFLHSIKNYLEDSITCPCMHECKEWEFALILRAYYSPEELMNFFFSTICQVQEFELFVMNNYLKMKGVKEFVDLSGMNLSAFNRKFKSHFGESPYQWLIKQRSKHIYYELTSTNRSLSTIAKEFYFTDSSHFNHYCKSMFGISPSKIRESYYEKSSNNK